MARGKDTLLAPGADKEEERIATANELQMGSVDPKLQDRAAQVK